jgi:hypothetical protein
VGKFQLQRVLGCHGGLLVILSQINKFSATQPVLAERFHEIRAGRQWRIQCRLSDGKMYAIAKVGSERFNSLVGRFCQDQSLPFKGDARNKGPSNLSGICACSLR